MHARLLLCEADRLWDLYIAEGESMDRDAYYRMIVEQHHDPEWLRINKILPSDPQERDDISMIKWVLYTLKLRIAWCRKWRLTHG